MRFLFLIGCALLLVPTGCSNTPPEFIDRPDMPDGGEEPRFLEAPTYEYRLGPGDVLRVNVHGHPELGSGLYRANTPGTPVNGAGVISLPLIGDVSANQKTLAEVQEAVVSGFQEYIKEPKVDVSIIEFGAHRIFVLGEVQKPGMLILERPTTALEALSLSGGFTSAANREQIAMVRGTLREENMIIFSGDGLDPLAGSSLRAGDIIFVGRRRWAGVSQAAKDLLPILSVGTLPVSTARDVAIFTDLMGSG